MKRTSLLTVAALVGLLFCSFATAPVSAQNRVVVGDPAMNLADLLQMVVVAQQQSASERETGTATKTAAPATDNVDSLAKSLGSEPRTHVVNTRSMIKVTEYLVREAYRCFPDGREVRVEELLRAMIARANGRIMYLESQVAKEATEMTSTLKSAQMRELDALMDARANLRNLVRRDTRQILYNQYRLEQRMNRLQSDTATAPDPDQADADIYAMYASRLPSDPKKALGKVESSRNLFWNRVPDYHREAVKRHLRRQICAKVPAQKFHSSETGPVGTYNRR